MPYKFSFALGLGFLVSAASADAAPIITPPPPLNATGNVTAIFVFADATDTSILSEITPVGINPIFCNHTGGGCTASVAGATMSLGNQTGLGQMVFGLDDITVGNHFTNAATDINGAYHAFITTDYSQFNAGALPIAAASVIQNLQNSGQTITYIGWEDRIAGQAFSDFDYNDLIFAFANTVSTRVPEPFTLSLFGAGLAGAAWLRRRRKAKA